MKKMIGLATIFLIVFVFSGNVQAKDGLTHHIILANYSGQDDTGWVDVGYEFTWFRVFDRIELGGAGIALDFKLRGNDSKSAIEIKTVVPLLTVPIANIVLAGDPDIDGGWLSFGTSIAFDPKNNWDHRFFFGFRASWDRWE